MGVARPVPVWLIPLIAALVAQGLLVQVGEPAVPRLEVSRVVDREGLLNVRYDEVVEPGPGPGSDGRRCASGELLQALDCVDVV